MKRTWPELQGIRVFEMHKRHGLHVHMVTNERIDVVQARALAEKAGWGRIHVTVMPAEHARYLAKYLSKERPPCLKRWRLWADIADVFAGIHAYGLLGLVWFDATDVQRHEDFAVSSPAALAAFRNSASTFTRPGS